jgi:hypothetical protein
MNKMMVQGHKLTFLINLLPKNQDQNLSPYIFERSCTPKCPPMEDGCDEHVCSGRKEGYIYHKHHWQLPLVTACVNPFSQAVVIKATCHTPKFTILGCALKTLNKIKILKFG